ASALQPGDRRGGRARVLHVPDDPARELEERLARRGGDHRAPEPVEQLDPELPLEAPNALRHRGLGDIEGLGRPREAAVVGDGDRVVDEPEFHRLSLSFRCEISVELLNDRSCDGIVDAGRCAVVAAVAGWTWLWVGLIGLAVGFIAGLFGKGGSAVATPLLHAAGVPAFVAVAAPLPATVPSTLAASWAYARAHLVDRRILAWSAGFGLPATALGALATRWIDGELLVRASELVVAGLGIRFLLRPGSPTEKAAEAPPDRARLAVVATLVGVASGLLANSGGFLLAPLYLGVLRMPIKRAFATSLAVASLLAVPGTLVHWALGHIDWAVVAVFGASS